jgi:hypothetical protein
MPTEPTPPAETDSASPEPAAVTIHEAELASGPSGGVIRGTEIDFASAVARRQTGKNVVVCSDNLKANRRQAELIEGAVGPVVRSVPHKDQAGPRALPHFQQQNQDHEGHTFYETSNLRALRRKG